MVEMVDETGSDLYHTEKFLITNIYIYIHTSIHIYIKFPNRNYNKCPCKPMCVANVILLMR